MADTDVRCVLVKIHGIGQQREPDWHAEFDQQLDAALSGLTNAQRGRFVNESVYWADLSTLLPSLVGATPDLGQPNAAVDAEYALARQSFANYLAAQGDPALATPALLGLPDPSTIITRLKDVTFSAADQAHDVAGYVSNNGLRTQILNRLATKLYELHDRYSQATLILGSHSQGTMVSYDVLRMVGSRLPRLGTWITMGCPLAWYANAAKWGRDILDVSPSVTWINYFDDQDPVGKALLPLVPWPAPSPQDIDVDNTGHGLNPHDHWHNPTVIQNYAALVTQALAG